MLRLLKPVEKSWKTLARFLLKEELQYKVEIIEAQYDTSQETFFSILKKWFDCTTRAKRTWQTLCSTAKKYGDESLEKYMEENYVKSKF